MALHPLQQTLFAKPISKEGLICRPLDTFSDITWFIDQPPAWRTLCKELTPHSKNKLKNIEIINRNIGDIRLEAPDTFCHYDPDAEDVLRYDENTLPKTLVCHDMANGYHDDSYIEGTANYAGYTFYNWAAIDIFCYFSHHFITIPPVSWINVAHEHGVKVIGTVITEWNEGVGLWDKILSSESESINFASSLVTIASTLKFDGWLMNIENKISSPDKLLDFVTTLHRMLHKELENGVLIWYDSVTVKGNLNWQNRLNEKNKAFFDACDGIFTNYSWDQADLQGSVEVAGDRIIDLYIGVDIWGRNFYGGGHLNTQEAVAMIHQYGCSVALFAPAWTYETLSTDPLDINGISMSEGLDKCALFYLRDRALWGSLWAFLTTRVPCQLPFRTSFCRGVGQQRRMYGEVLCNAPWYNLRHQQYQPNSAHGPHGYLITSFEVILKHAQDYKESHQKGILRYRDSFQLTQSDRLSQAQSQSQTRSSAVSPNQESPTAIDSLTKVSTTCPGQSSDQRSALNQLDSDDEDQKSLKTFYDTYVESLHNEEMGGVQFNHNIDAEDDPEYMDAGPSIPLVARTPDGKAMQQMSIKIRLGTRQRRAFGLTRVPGEMECLEFWLEDSFNGGACLRIHPSDDASPAHHYSRLFHCDFLCDTVMMVCVVTKAEPPSTQSLNILLKMNNVSCEPLTVVLLGRDMPQGKEQNPAARGQLTVSPLDEASFAGLRNALLVEQPACYVPLHNDFGWRVRYYQLTLPGCRVTSVCCHALLKNEPIMLGHLAIVPLKMA